MTRCGESAAGCSTTRSSCGRSSHTHCSGSPGAPAVPADNVPTHARFCQEKPQHNIWCDRSADIQDALAGIDPLNPKCAPAADGTAPCPNVEAPTDRYHRISFSSGGNGSDPNGPAAEPNYEYDAVHETYTDPDGPAELTWNWDSLDDYQRWTAPAVNFMPNVSEATQLSGTLWLDAETDVGETVNVGTGLHGDQLANHHKLHVQPSQYRCRGGAAIYQQLEFFFLWPTLPDPPYKEAFRRWDQVRGEASIVVDVGDGEWGAIDLRGDAHLVTERMGAGLRAAASDPSLVWVNAVEPFVYQGAGLSFPHTLALSSNGSEMVHWVSTDGVSLQGNGDRPTCTVGAGDAPAFLASWVCRAPGPASLSPRWPLTCSEACSSST